MSKLIQIILAAGLVLVSQSTTLFADSARVAGDLKVDGIHFTEDNSVIRKLADLTSPWTLLGGNIYYLSGNVGIGTMTPGAPLDVNGNAIVSGSLATGSITTSGPITSTLSGGTPPLAISSTTLVPNLNAEMVGGMKASDILNTSSASLNTAVTDINGQLNNLATTYSSSWKPGTQIQSSSMYDVFDPQLISYGNGNAMLVWRQSDGMADHIMYTNYDSAYQYWSMAFALDFGSSNAASPRLTPLANSGVMAVWRQSDGVRDNLWASRFEPMTHTWSMPGIIGTSNGPMIGSPSVAADATGNAIVIWCQHNGSRNAIYARRFTQSMGWESISQLDADQSGAGETPELAVNAEGRAMAVWRQYNGGRNTIRTSLYSQSSWGQSQQLDTVGSGDSSLPQIAFNYSVNSFAIAVWTQNDGTRDNIWWNLNTMGSWGTPALLENDDSGNASRPQIVITNTGYAMAAWDHFTNGNSTLYARRYLPNTGWDNVQTVQRAIPGQTSLRLAQHSSGNTVAVWYQGSEIWGNNYQDRTGWASAKRIDRISGEMTNPPAQPVAIMLGPTQVMAAWSKNNYPGAKTLLWNGIGTLFTDQAIVLQGSGITGPGSVTITAPDAGNNLTTTLTLPTSSGRIITTGNLTDITATGTVTSGTWNAQLGTGVVTGDSIAAGAVTGVKITDNAISDVKISGPISGNKLGSHTHAGSDINSGGLNGSLINNNTISAAKLGEVCADGDLMRYDAKANRWGCNPQNGAFTAAEQFIGALTLTGITASTADIAVNGFTLGIENIGAGTVSGKAVLNDVRIQVPVQKLIPILNQTLAKGTHITQGIICSIIPQQRLISPSLHLIMC